MLLHFVLVLHFAAIVITFCVSITFCADYYILRRNSGFHVKAKSERFTAASLRCRQNLKYENFTSSFGRLRQNIAPKSVPHVQHDYFSLFNQSNH